MEDNASDGFRVFLYSEKGINQRSGKEAITNYYLTSYKYGLSISRINKDKDDGINKLTQVYYYRNHENIYKHLLKQKENEMVVSDVDSILSVYSKAVSEVNALVADNIAGFKKLFDTIK